MIDVVTYALCKKYCDTHASTLTPEQAVAAVNTYFTEHPGEIVTNSELETILENYAQAENLEGLATETWVENKGYLVDAVIEVAALPTANIKTDVVYRLKKPSTESCLGTLINRYSARTDLSNQGNKVTTGVDAGGVHYFCQWKWLNLCYPRVAPAGQDVVPIEQYWDASMPRTFGEKAKDLFYVDNNGPLVRYTDHNNITQACYKDTWLNSFNSYEYYSYNGFAWDKLVLDSELASELQSYMPLITLPTGEDKKFNFVLQLHSDATSSYQWEEQAETDLSEYAKTSEVTAAVNNAVADLIDGAPETLDTLKELAENFDGMATQAWVESKGYITEALPEGTEAGQALIYDGEAWSKQNGYGYELAPETNINFDGDIDGLAKVETAYFPFYKLPYEGYLPQVDDLMGQTVYYKYNDSLETSEWNADDVQTSPEGTLELMKDDFADTIIIVYDDVTMPKYDNASFSKGIWVAKQDDSNYIMDIYFGPIVNQIDAKFIPSDDNKANNDAVVNLTDDQIINGEKEFTSPIKFESGLSTTSFGQGGVSIGAFAQPLTKYNFATDGSDYVVDGEVTVASREWVGAQGYLTSDSMPEICDNLETDDSNLPLSAAQGVALKGMIDGIEGFSVQYISLEGTSGTLTDDELAVLQDNSLNYIYLDGVKYTQTAYAIGRGGIFATYSANPGINTKNIIISVGSKGWEYSESAIYDNSTIVNSSNKLAVNSDLSLNTITTASTASLNNGSLQVKKLANNKPGVIGSGSVVLNRNTSYNEENIGENSVIVGMGCHTQNQAAIAAGKDSVAGGSFSCAINQETRAGAVDSFAQGYQTWVSGVYSQAFGKNTIAAGGAQTVLGQWNVPNTSDKMIVGTGSGEVSKGTLSATGIIGYYYANANPAKGENKYVLITADNADEVWNNSSITKVYELNNALAVTYTGEVVMNKVSDGTTTRNMSDLLAVKIQPITLAEYQALPTPRPTDVLYIITN